MAARPGFVDEGGGKAAPNAATSVPGETASAPPTRAPLGPMLLDSGDQASTGKIDHHWSPALVRPLLARPGSLSWISTGIAVILVGWVTVSAAAFVHDQFVRSRGLGFLISAIFAVSFGFVLFGVLIELKNYLGLRRIDQLRTALADPALLGTDAKRLCLAWLNTISTNLPDAELALRSVTAAEDTGELRGILRNRVLTRLDQMARQSTAAAAIQDAVVVAVVPHPALDGLVTGLRALVLVRQIAKIYGVRPSIVVTLALLRRIAWTAAQVSATDILTQSVMELVAHRMPVIKHVTESVPGAGVAAWRVARLGLVTAKACSPLNDK